MHVYKHTIQIEVTMDHSLSELMGRKGIQIIKSAFSQTLNNEIINTWMYSC